MEKANGFRNEIDRILNAIGWFLKSDGLKTKFTELKSADKSLETCLGIRSVGRHDGKMSGMLDMETFDKLQTNRLAIGTGRIVIVDISRQRYQVDTFEGKNLEYAGILPVITTAANALYVQNQLGHSGKSNRDL